METSAHIKYLLANEQDNRWGVVVTTTGYQIIEPQTSYPPSNHPVRYLFSVEKGRLLNEYQLIYISRGDGQFVSASHKETSFEGGGKFILLFPGEWHSYRPSPKTGWHEYWIGFTGPDIDRKVGTKFLDPHRPLFNVGYHEDIINLYKLALRTAQEQGSDGAWGVEITVQDQGPGADPQTLEKMTTRFYRAESDRPGYGLGLASVLAIVQLHGGKLSFHNANPGMVARIWLPAVADV